VRSLKATSRWDPEELARVFSATLGENLKAPPAGGFGTMLDQRPADEWSEVDGYRFWHSPHEVPAAEGAQAPQPA
jgi:hypothetical protein